MKHFIALLFLLTTANAGVMYEKFFRDSTCRVDYYHTGTATEEFVSLDQVYEEGAWPGSRIQLVDDLNLGHYLLRVYDKDSGHLIFSRGYSTVFGEWQTIDEAKNGVYRTMHETVRFPFPRQTVKIAIFRRTETNAWKKIFATEIDPESRFVNREKPYAPYTAGTLINNGSPSQKIDLLILGDGYTAEEQAKFEADVNRYTNSLFSTEPFKSRKSQFNVRMINAISPESGIDQPRKNIWKNNILGTSYNSFDSPRYVLTLENRLLRDIAALVPYDHMMILVNSPRYGGGGIFNWYGTCYTGNEEGDPEWWSDYVFVHEFGHHFAGLADEYYTSSVSYDEFYPQGVEPWEPNITRLLTGKTVKWQSLVNLAEIPSPWEKGRYDSLSTVYQSLDKEAPDYRQKSAPIKGQMDDILANPQLKGKVGAFEGAGYSATGIYRPSLDCRMFSKSLADFCPVCRGAIEKVIDFHTK